MQRSAGQEGRWPGPPIMSLSAEGRGGLQLEDGEHGPRPPRRRGALARNQRALESETKLRLKLTVQIRFSVDRTEVGAQSISEGGDRQ